MIPTVTDKFYIHDTKIFFRNNTEKDFEDDWLKHKFRHYGYFYQILNMLAADGFDVQADPNVDKIIRKDHYIGKFHELEFEAKKYPNGFEIGFFQNVVYENPNGGRYDFDKLSKVNAPALLLSYARPIISSVTNQAGMKPLNLPFVNFINQQKDTN